MQNLPSGNLAARPRGNLKGFDWSTNGAGREFSHAFGFGLMDAGAMTRDVSTC